VIALEEHYWDPGVAETFTGRNATRSSDLLERLYDLGELSLKEMDEARIGVQVLSHGAPSTQRLDAETVPNVAAAANNRLYETVQSNSEWFVAFAALPTAHLRATANELERSVTRLGLRGAMIHGLTNGGFCDGKGFLAKI